MLDSLTTSVAPITADTWPADIALRLSHSKHGTRLSRCEHRGPLYVQKPFYPEGPDHAHLYLLHPPAGIVSGDTLTIKVDVEPNAAALITTPGATIVYRAREDNPIQRQVIDINVQSNATLEWFPLETIVHNHACFEATTIINMEANSHFCGWEITSLGLPAKEQLFTDGRFRQRYEIKIDGTTQFIDQININDSNRKALLNSKAGMQNYMINGFCVFGPVDNQQQAESRHNDTQLERLRAEQLDCTRDCQVSITRLGDFYVGRYLGTSAEQARRHFTQWWSIIRQEMLDKEAYSPNVWFT